MKLSRDVLQLRSVVLGCVKPWRLWPLRQSARAALGLVIWFVWLSPLIAGDNDSIGKPIERAAMASADSPTNGLGSWIWTAKVFDRQTCELWRSFEIPLSPPVTHARLRMTADNEYTLHLDGREVGRGAEWREIFDYNLTPLMSPGWHVLAVKAHNSSSFAGMILGMQIDLSDGQTLDIESDQNWRVVPDGTKGWERATRARDTWAHATVQAPLGGAPWWSTPQNVNAMPTLQPIEVFFWQTGWFQALLLLVCGLVILFSLKLMAQLALHKKERLLLQRERARIARDIHDDLGSRMTQLVLHGEVAQSELPGESSTRAQLDRICQEAREVLSTMDEILWAVNPRRDTLNDFSSYVCSYAEEFLKPSSIQCRFDVDAEMSAVVLDLPVRRALLMVIKEAINNAVKYSGATELLIQIKWQEERLTVVVQDNGRGFDPQTVRPGRNGLRNMAQRLRELGGHCGVSSQPGKGCRVEFTLALGPSRWQSLNWIWKPKQLPVLSKQTKDPEPANEASQTYDPAAR